MTRITIPSLALFALASLAVPAFAEPVAFGPLPGAAINVAKLAPIEAFVDSEGASANTPGAIVRVHKHGKPLSLKLFGKRDPDAGTPMTEDTIFPIHSVTKT